MARSQPCQYTQIAGTLSGTPTAEHMIFEPDANTVHRKGRNLSPILSFHRQVVRHTGRMPFEGAGRETGRPGHTSNADDIEG